MTLRAAPSLSSHLGLETPGDLGQEPLPLEHFDPQRRPDLKLALLNQASLLCKAALSRAWNSPAEREQTALLFEWADRLHQDPSASAQDLRSLAMTLAELPPPLIRLAGHRGACDTAQGELGKLRSALDNAEPDARMTAQDRAGFRRYAHDNQKLLDEARDKIETGRLSDLPDLARRIQARNATLRGALERAGLSIPTGTPPEAIVPAPVGRPAPPPASKRFHLATALRGAFSRLAGTANAARGAFVPQLRAQGPERGQGSPRADALRLALIDTDRELFALELKVTQWANQLEAQDRGPALTLRNVDLRRARALLDKACTKFKPDAAGCRAAQAAIDRVLDVMAAVPAHLRESRRVASPIAPAG